MADANVTRELAPSSSVADECLRVDPDNLDAHVVLCTDHVIAGEASEARMVAKEILRIDPSFKISTYLETQPYKERETLERIAHALRDAGLAG